MSAISEVSVSILASEPPTSPTTSTLAGGLFLAGATGSIYYASPLRLTRVLVTAITETEKAYLQALERDCFRRRRQHCGNAGYPAAQGLNHPRSDPL
ncbi:hypothetical protein B0H13DRAFT_2672060 [Mycena leptocephala]|nr:hypothetical protein B0H13DRAFT_2672060 [Mycena leptocephala]